MSAEQRNVRCGKPHRTTPARDVRSSDAKAATANDYDKLEDAIFSQLTSLYRDGSLIRETIEQVAAKKEGDRTAFAEERASLAKEIARAQRAIERYHDAFENVDLAHSRFKQRLSALDTHLAALHEQDQTLASELAADAPTTPDSSVLRAVADQLGHTGSNQ